jgi:hypothetical protein
VPCVVLLCDAWFSLADFYSLLQHMIYHAFSLSSVPRDDFRQSRHPRHATRAQPGHSAILRVKLTRPALVRSAEKESSAISLAYRRKVDAKAVRRDRTTMCLAGAISTGAHYAPSLRLTSTPGRRASPPAKAVLKGSTKTSADNWPVNRHPVRRAPTGQVHPTARIAARENTTLL